VEAFTRLGRGGTNVTAGVVAVTVRGASVGFAALVALVAVAVVDVACLAFVVGAVAAAVALPAFVLVAVAPVAFVALVARALDVVVAFVAVLAATPLDCAAGLVAGGRRRAGVFFATASVVRSAGARLVRPAGCFCRGSSMDIPVALPMDASFGETETVVSCWAPSSPSECRPGARGS